MSEDLRLHGLIGGGAKINTGQSELQVETGYTIMKGDLVNINMQEKITKNKQTLSVVKQQSIGNIATYGATAIGFMQFESPTKGLILGTAGGNVVALIVTKNINKTLTIGTTPTTVITGRTIGNVIDFKILSNGKYVIIYQNSSNYPCVKILRINGSTIEFGAELAINTSTTSSTSFIETATDKFLLVNANAGTHTLYGINISTLTATIGASQAVSPTISGTDSHKLAKSGTNKAILLYKSMTAGVGIKRVDFNGSSITQSTERILYEDSNTIITDIVEFKVSGITHYYLVAYNDYSGSDAGDKILVVSHVDTATTFSILQTKILPNLTSQVNKKTVLINENLVFGGVDKTANQIAFIYNLNNTTLIDCGLQWFENEVVSRNNMVTSNAVDNIIYYLYSDATANTPLFIKIIESKIDANGISIQNGNAGETIKIYDWR